MFGNKKQYPLNKMELGFTFKVFKETWAIKEIGEYSWDDSTMSIEYTIESNSKKAFLEVESYKGEFEVSFSESLALDNLDFEEAIADGIIQFEGKEYELDKSYSGSYRNLTTYTNRETLTSHQFYYKDNYIVIEKWNDGAFETFIGEELKPNKITNINTK